MPSRSTIGYACTAGALAVVAALAYDAIPDLPLAPQSDEPKKADFVLAGGQDFLQPLLLVQTVRLANLIARYTDQLALVELGRTVAAMFGGLTVLATIVLARRVVGRPLALAAGLLAAVTPLVAFHAQLLKEDIFVAPWLLFALAALDRLRENAETRRGLAFGLLVGLATSAKYIGIVLLPLACVVPLIAPIADVRRYYAALTWSAGTAVVVFALINAPAFLTPEIFMHGLNTRSRTRFRTTSSCGTAGTRIFCFTGRPACGPGSDPRWRRPVSPERCWSRPAGGRARRRSASCSCSPCSGISCTSSPR